VIVDPSGAILAAASPDREEIIRAEISEQVIADVRNRVTVFAHRRAELYNIGQNDR
jgi:predicted amidohydrolase